jgi:hypothetical protein
MAAVSIILGRHVRELLPFTRLIAADANFGKGRCLRLFLQNVQIARSSVDTAVAIHSCCSSMRKPTTDCHGTIHAAPSLGVVVNAHAER